MDGLDNILASISNLASEINDSYHAIPLDSNLKVSSPIEDMNRKLNIYKNYLYVSHMNSVSIPLHRDEILRIAIKTGMDIMGFSETNIKKNTPRDLFKFKGYKLFNNNREWGNNGGVGIMIKNEYAKKAKQINVNFKQTQPEHIFVEIEINKLKILIGVLYKSPSVRYGVFNDIFETLAFLTTKYDHCLFLGDFNINQLTTTTAEYKFFQNNILKPLSLTQLITEPTRVKETSTLIDLILATSPDHVKFSSTADFPGVSDHKLIYCCYSLKKDKFRAETIRRRDFRKFEKATFIQEMQNVDWNPILNIANNNIDEATSKLESIYINSIDRNAPYRNIKVCKPVTASYFTDEITAVMDLRDKYKKKYNEIKNNNHKFNLVDSPNDTFYYKRFKELKNQVNHMIRKAKFKDLNNKINEKVADSKKFHFNLKEFNVVSSKKNNDVKCHLDPDTLNKNFVKNNNTPVCEKHIKKMIRKINKNSRLPNFDFQPVNAGDVIKTVKTLKSNACGIDEISSFFIKLSITSSASAFAEIVNASLKSGRFPSRWKKARIKPIPKIPEPITAGDFRPISLLPAFSKIIEKLMAAQMKKYFIDNNLLDVFQSAYRAKHSTITALVDITDNILKALDDSEIIILVLLDYSKAFDIANHKLILAKLKAMGFKNSALNWIESYLSGRSQQVVTDSGTSSWLNILNGVPQGSILGPLLFTILVSDISSGLKHCKYHLYADDTQLYIRGKVENINDLIKKVNKDLAVISDYSVNNCLKLNQGKSVYIIIGSRKNIAKLDEGNLPPIKMNNEIIKRETTVKNLGVLFDQFMSWDSEINKCISNGYLKLRQAYRFSKFLSKKSKTIIVQSYILSQFNYSSIILQNLTKTQMDKLQKFQNTCVRFILNLRKFDHISEGYTLLKFLKMHQMRDTQALTLMHKIKGNLAPHYLTSRLVSQGNHHSHRTRAVNNIFISRFKNNYGRDRFFNRIAKKYNELTTLLQIAPSLSVSTFKEKIKKHFIT